MGKTALELYLHIPFCVKKCNYCDFLSAPASEEIQDKYMRSLLREVAQRSHDCEKYQVVSVFFGGGTPSVADTDRIGELMEEIRKSYDLSQDAEISIEVNPGTADAAKLCRYRDFGINRLSIGLQSAKDAELERLGRIHTFSQFLTIYGAARAAGFDNVNVDIMSGLPGQSLESFKYTLHAVTSLDPIPEHISAYSLIVEEGTPFHEMQSEGRLDLPDEDCERQMYYATGNILSEYGYRRYEISNYAREGYECRHNIGYWKRAEYLGFGIGAASLMDERRFHNGTDLKRYLEDPLGVREDVQCLTQADRMEEFMFLGLRMMDGISSAEFREVFNRSVEDVYGDVLAQNINDGLLEKRNCFNGDVHYSLTDRGIDLSNYVMAQFLF